LLIGPGALALRAGTADAGFVAMLVTLDAALLDAAHLLPLADQGDQGEQNDHTDHNGDDCTSTHSFSFLRLRSVLTRCPVLEKRNCPRGPASRT
jgi:hypothetical protein